PARDEPVAVVAEEPGRDHGADAGLVVAQVDPDGAIPVDVAVPRPGPPAGPPPRASDCGPAELGEPTVDVSHRRGHDSPYGTLARLGHHAGPGYRAAAGQRAGPEYYALTAQRRTEATARALPVEESDFALSVRSSGVPGGSVEGNVGCGGYAAG